MKIISILYYGLMGLGISLFVIGVSGVIILENYNLLGCGAGCGEFFSSETNQFLGEISFPFMGISLLLIITALIPAGIEELRGKNI